MRCISCGFENECNAKFCDQCGARQVRVCPKCGHELRDIAKFCSECGTAVTDMSAPVIVSQATLPAPIQYTPRHLAERILNAQAARATKGRLAGERKIITALFADMAASTALIQDLDPEEARGLIDPVLALMMDAVHHYEGYVAKSLGDGILAMFGAPIAHEDHPQRALYAALRMQEEMRRYADQIRLEQGIALQIRVGIHTGEVVVRSVHNEDLHIDYDPIGQSIHLASRMEGIATPGSTIVSEATFRLVEGYFEFRPLGATRIKGLSEPICVYEVLGNGPLRTRLQVAARRGLAGFVGRKAELETLAHALGQIQGACGQLVGVVGEPGVGKSRLFLEFRQRCQKDILVLDTFSVSHGKAFAYLPLIELLRNYFQISPKDDERGRREKITGKVLTLDRALEDCLLYLFSLLGVSEPDSLLLKMDVKIRRQRTFEAIKRLLVRESLDQPVVLIVEDLQWLDRETEAFLNFFSDSVAGARILLLVNYRPEYQHSWGQKTWYTQLRLDPLGQTEAGELLRSLLGDEATLASLKPRIMQQTEGNPFFIEEVVQTLVEEKVLSGESGHYHLEQVPTDLHIPTTVQGVLSARIDRLAVAEKELLQTLAVIGKEFPWSLVQRVVDLQDDATRRLLSRLQAGEFLYERPAFPEVEYTFKHGLTQEVAYNSLLLERRRELHGQTALAIETLYQTALEDHYSELAHHFSRSGNTEKAVEYLHRAGKQAAQRSANQEAIGQFSDALALLQRLPDVPERAHHELALQIDLGHAYMATKGFGSREVEATFTRALTLCRELGEPPQLFSVLVGLRRFYTLRADFRMARELGARLLDMARSAADPALLMQAHGALGATLFFQGELEASRKHCEQGFALYDREQHRSHTLLYGIDPGTLALDFIAWTLWYRGYPDQALATCQQALALAEEVPVPYSLADPMIFRAEIHCLRHEVQAAKEWAEAVITLAREQGFQYWLARATVLHGWALAEQGQHEAGVTEIRQAMLDYRSTGGEMLRPFFLGLLAAALGKAGDTRAALEVLAEALLLVDKTGERFYEAQLTRLKGEFILEQAATAGTSATAREDAEACFQQAIAVARTQGARSLELGAVTSLCRLWQQQGRSDAARARLAEIYATFDEGFDTVDLQAAKDLLNQLS